MNKWFKMNEKEGETLWKHMSDLDLSQSLYFGDAPRELRPPELSSSLPHYAPVNPAAVIQKGIGTCKSETAREPKLLLLDDRLGLMNKSAGR